MTMKSPPLRTSTTWTVVALLALISGACSSSTRAQTPLASQAPTATAVPIVTTTAADLCHRFIGTFLTSARERWSGQKAAAQYGALAQGGTAADAEIASKVGALAGALATPTTSLSAKVTDATTAALSTCKQRGYPMSPAQIQQLKGLLIQTFSTSTTTTEPHG
jgi:hypothetical protein